MHTPLEAEVLATAHIQHYINSCECQSIEDVGNVLMKLLNIVGQALVGTQGKETAFVMIEKTTQSLKNEYSDEAGIHFVH